MALRASAVALAKRAELDRPSSPFGRAAHPQSSRPLPPALALALALCWPSPFLHRFFDPTPSKTLTSNYRARLHWLGGLASPARECTGLVSLCSWFGACSEMCMRGERNRKTQETTHPQNPGTGTWFDSTTAEFLRRTS